MAKNGGRLSYFLYFLTNVPSVLGYKLFHIIPQTKHFRGTKLSLNATNDVLENALSGSEPFAAIRFGATEISCLNNHEKIRLGLRKDYKELVRYSMKNNAGYFPTTDADLKRYGDELLLALEGTTYLGISGVHMENYFAKYFCPNASYILYEGMEPLRGSWTHALKGKKVLVISSFDREIRDQYAKREKLFSEDPLLLPEMELKTIKAPVTFAGVEPTSSSFFEELEKVERQMDAMDYEVLLVGAGAYGSFLALYAKSKGKKAIQTGGATATLFGILGKRWEKREHVAKHVNSSWIRPYEKPQGFEKIEGGAYW